MFFSKFFLLASLIVLPLVICDAAFGQVTPRELTNEDVPRLGAMAVSKSLDSVFTFTLWRRDFVGPEEGDTCTLNRVGQEAEILKAANAAIIHNRNKRERARHRVEFQHLYKSVQDLANHYSGGDFPEFGRSLDRQCITFVDFAYNIVPLYEGFNDIQSDIGYVLREYKTTEVLAFANGFASSSEYLAAKAIGLTARQFRDISRFGILSPNAFNEALGEMNNSGYSQLRSADELISFLRDRDEGRGKGLSATQVRSARNRAYEQDLNARKQAREQCLVKFGYYRTSNQAAKLQIAAKC